MCRGRSFDAPSLGILISLLAGCFGIEVSPGTLLCSSTDPRPCPSGMVCRQNPGDVSERCYPPGMRPDGALDAAADGRLSPDTDTVVDGGRQEAIVGPTTFHVSPVGDNSDGLSWATAFTDRVHFHLKQSVKTTRASDSNSSNQPLSTINRSNRPNRDCLAIENDSPSSIGRKKVQDQTQPRTDKRLPLRGPSFHPIHGKENARDPWVISRLPANFDSSTE